MTQYLPSPPTRRRSRPAAPAIGRPAGQVTLLALLLALVLGACGAATSSDGVVSLVDPSASPSAEPTASLDPEEAMLAFTRCMREHGIDVNISTVEGGPVGGTTDRVVEGDVKTGPGAKADDPQAFQEANEACRELLPAAGQIDPNATMDPEVQDQMLAFSRCMREHGIDFPDPQFSGGGAMLSIGGEDGGGIDPNSEEFQAAQEACQGELPGGKLGGPAPAPAAKP